MSQSKVDPEVACWTISELLEKISRLVSEVVPGGQDRYKVTEVPDARTLRYYVSSGVVDRPGGRRGTASMYGRRHLLQVLAVKRLQAEHLPLRKIGLVLQGKSIQELEALLGPGLRAVELTPDVVPGPSNWEGLPTKPGEAWRRHCVAEGVELHLADGLALSPAARRAALDAIQQVLGRRPRGSSDAEKA